MFNAVRVYVGVGSNMERSSNVRSGIAALREHFGKLQLSGVYDSEAVGFAGENFFNMVVGLDTAQSVMEVVATLHDIECRHGRKRSANRFEPRSLDLDLLLYDNLIMDAGGLQIPRNEIVERAFVLRPLAEIAPQVIHPVIGHTFEELWQGFDHTTQRLSPVELRL